MTRKSIFELSPDIISHISDFLPAQDAHNLGLVSKEMRSSTLTSSSFNILIDEEKLKNGTPLSEDIRNNFRGTVKILSGAGLEEVESFIEYLMKEEKDRNVSLDFSESDLSAGDVLMIPENYAHGFYTKSSNTILQYLLNKDFSELTTPD